MKNTKGLARRQAGQSMVLLMFIVVTLVAISTSSIMMSIVNSGSVTALENGIEARQYADSGAENALLRLIRDPFYTGELYSIDDGEIEIIVTGQDQKTILVEASVGQSSKVVEVLTDYTDNVLSVTSWREIF